MTLGIIFQKEKIVFLLFFVFFLSVPASQRRLHYQLHFFFLFGSACEAFALSSYPLSGWGKKKISEVPCIVTWAKTKIASCSDVFLQHIFIIIFLSKNKKN